MKKFSIKNNLQIDPAQFDPAIFQDLRTLLGDACVITTLLDLSTDLQQTFHDPTLANTEREQLFEKAHYFTARAGIIGFACLYRKCLALQDVCMSDMPIEQAYLDTRRTAQTTRIIIEKILDQNC